MSCFFCATSQALHNRFSSGSPAARILSWLLSFIGGVLLGTLPIVVALEFHSASLARTASVTPGLSL